MGALIGLPAAVTGGWSSIATSRFARSIRLRRGRNHQGGSRLALSGLLRPTADRRCAVAWRGRDRRSSLAATLALALARPEMRRAPGRGGIARIIGPNDYEIVADGLNNPVAIAIGNDDTTYVAEFAQDNRSESGRVLAIRGTSRRVLAEGLNFPTSLAWDPRGYLWIGTQSPLPAAKETRDLRAARHKDLAT